MRAMILAAGLGTRLRPLTLKTPKPLLKVGGKSLIEYQIENLKRAGISQIIINHAWLGEQIEAALGDGAQLGVQLVYSAEDEPLETAGGVRKALPWLVAESDEPFLLVNGDVFTDVEYAELELRLPASVNARLWLVANPSWHKDGDFHLSIDGRLSEDAGLKLTFAGISLLRPSLFAHLTLDHPAPLAPLLRKQIAAGHAQGEILNGYWNDVGTPDRLEQVERFISQQERS
jgi:MurNAc alpha-1-phosphate uridylyltransferase